MPNLVVSDFLLQQQTKWLRGLLNGGFLRLYANSVPPSPANVLRDFVEAYFTGYIPQQITWGQPVKVQSGEWSIQSPNAIFVNTGTTTQIVYGWFFTTTLGFMLSAPFPASVTLNPGSKLGVQVLLTDWASFTLVGS